MLPKPPGTSFFFIDDDILLDSDYVAAHVNLHRKNENIATVGNLHFPAEKVSQNNIMRYLDSRYLGSRKLSELEYLNNLPAENFGAAVDWNGINHGSRRKIT